MYKGGRIVFFLGYLTNQAMIFKRLRGNFMNHTTDRCSRLRTLHDHLTNEVKNMRESLQRAQQEGISTSAESLNTLRSLQAALNNISRELQKCPPEKSEESATEGRSQPYYAR
ncbi:hypothetical protein KSD_06660 [Ktedonobacter sp. SOSP1-85]|nr:hypothetical protein KSD_06660 [Ktedonobacter sp. SOSP1-85]